MAKERPEAPGTEASTPDRILLAAERLFSERGIDGVSLREITSAAGVNSAAAHYHFGSKEAVLAELFARRARPIADRRAQLLGEVKTNRQGRPAVEDVLRAFLQPALDLMETPEGLAFTRLRARMMFERDDIKREIMARTFDATSRMAMEALARALPRLPQKELQWRFHFLLGSMVYSMARPGRIESVTKGSLRTDDPRATLDHLVRYAAAGLRAP